MNRHVGSTLFTLGNKLLGQVDEDNYLEQVVSADLNQEKEMRRRICIGWEALGKNSQIMNGRLPPSLQRMVYNQCVSLVMKYAAETWRLTKHLERKLRSPQQAMHGTKDDKSTA